MMMFNIISHILLFFMKGGENIEVETIWANEIMLGNVTFNDVPKKLKPKVKTVLENAGFPELAE